MQQSVPKASELGLTEELRKEEEWAAKEIHLMTDKHKVSELPKCPNCSSLIALYLQGNYELTAIPPLFFQHMALLQVLDLSRTSIKSLPKSLPKLVALKKLLLRGCELFMELSPQVGKLKNLEELDLDETQLMDLPREIVKLLKLRHLRVSFYHICGKKKSKSNKLIDPETISILSQLTELSIDVNPMDKRWDDSVEDVLKEVCNSKTLRTLSLYLPQLQLLDYTSVLYSSLSRFRFTVGNHKRRIISRVPHEVEAEFRNWDKCLKFVNGENIPIEIIVLLKNSNSFFLDHHATAMNLSEFGIENMKRLKFCLLAECNKMETLIDGEMHYERNEHVLKSLEYLSIYYMENLGSIWRGTNHYGCMSKLKFLSLHTCPKLNIIFSPTSLENFVNLEEFILEDCPQVTSLVSRASIKPIMSDKIFLPSLKRLLLLYLPELVSISNGLLIAPKLESIGFYNCPKLKIISKMELSSKTLKIIKGECQWWEDMSWNETEWGNRPDYLMRIFSPISNEKDVMTQLAENTDFSEATIQNEGRQLGYAEEKTTRTDVRKSTSSESILPSIPWLRTSDASQQAWSFSSEKEWLEDSEISEVENDEDEPKAKRWNCTENENKGVIGSASKIARGDRIQVLPSPTTKEFAAQSLNQKSNSCNNQQSINRKDNNFSGVCLWPQLSSLITSSTMTHLSTTTIPTVLPSPTTKEFAVQFLNQKSNSCNNQQSISPKDNNSSDVCHLPQSSSLSTSSTITEFPATTLPTPSGRCKAEIGEDVPKAKKGRNGVRKVIRVPAISSMIADIPPDEYSWRKFGQKLILGSPYPRNYYRCIKRHIGCPATKLVERFPDDPSMFIVTYRGEHCHSGYGDVFEALLQDKGPHPGNSSEP
ncbi:hypothetical protein CRYUN_Cryun13aG0025300 [Craigia yunnanensis]